MCFLLVGVAKCLATPFKRCHYQHVSPISTKIDTHVDHAQTHKKVWGCLWANQPFWILRAFLAFSTCCILTNSSSRNDSINFKTSVPSRQMSDQNILKELVRVGQNFKSPHHHTTNCVWNSWGILVFCACVLIYCGICILFYFPYLYSIVYLWYLKVYDFITLHM